MGRNRVEKKGRLDNDEGIFKGIEFFEKSVSEGHAHLEVKAYKERMWKLSVVRYGLPCLVIDSLKAKQPRFDFLAGTGIFFFHIGSGAHPICLKCSLGVKWPECESDYLSSFTGDVKNTHNFYMNPRVAL